MDSTFASPQKKAGKRKIRMEMKKVSTLFSAIFSQWNFHSKEKRETSFRHKTSFSLIHLSLECLFGQKENVIRTFPTCAENFSVIWKITIEKCCGPYLPASSTKICKLMRSSLGHREPSHFYLKTQLFPFFLSTLEAILFHLILPFRFYFNPSLAALFHSISTLHVSVRWSDTFRFWKLLCSDGDWYDKLVTLCRGKLEVLRERVRDSSGINCRSRYHKCLCSGVCDKENK